MSEPKKILVGEDSSIIINLTKNVLAFENYQMKAARNGKQVLDLLANEDFDLILMDITMPVMDGVQCTKEIRSLADPKKSKLPIIAISGNAPNYTPEEFRKFGFNDFIQKPLDYDVVLATVKKFLS
ncbi:MAG: response regulator [Algoriphagus aquaeductus]|uniref:Response regulator receiver domain-containing protein n=1 Tax=Algoriphagus aquaeductus TaxID=475299 RepID=A0A326RYN5_9BACT|nr:MULTISPECIES: response regulator [Algoriphagus]PZV87429.1 response regulator receiver domain-containing protein [Algoriphagus aquaeductus]